jgi:hypothetical protein
MKVRHLIEKLKQLDQELPVYYEPLKGDFEPVDLVTENVMYVGEEDIPFVHLSSVMVEDAIDKSMKKAISDLSDDDLGTIVGENE